MPRIILGRFPRLAALLVAGILSLGLVAAASADTPPGRGPNGGPALTPPPGDCAVLRVQLNGAQPGTPTCLAATGGQGTDPSAPMGIAVGTPNCLSTDV